MCCVPVTPMRRTVAEPVEPVTVSIDRGDRRDLADLARSAAEEFAADGYAGPDDAVAEELYQEKSPVYTVSTLLPEFRIDGNELERQAYADPDEPYELAETVGRAVPDPRVTPRGIVDGLEEDELYLRTVAYATDARMQPTYRIREFPVPTEVERKDAHLDRLERVHRAVDRSQQDLGWYETFVRVQGFDAPQPPLAAVENAEFKVAAALHTDLDRHVDIGYLVDQENSSTEFGIEVRAGMEQPGELFDPHEREVPASGPVRDVVDDLTVALEDEGFAF